MRNIIILLLFCTSLSAQEKQFNPLIEDNFDMVTNIGTAIISQSDELDYFADIQTKLNRGNILITSGVYEISQPIIVPSNRVIEINGTIKIKDAVIKSLTVSLLSGFNRFYLDSADNFYDVGQWVNITDTLQPVVGGGAGHIRRLGFVSKIINIADDTIYLESNSNIAISATALPQVGTYNSAFILENVDSVIIRGTGTIDGNRDNQFHKGAWNSITMEEIRSGNALSIKYCSEIKIEGINIKNCNLHGITTWACNNIKADRISIINTDNKSWLFSLTTDSKISNSNADSADYEDGFMLYYGNQNIEFTNCSAKENGRYGLGVNSTNKNIVVNNFISKNNGVNYYVGLSTQVYMNNLVSVKGGVIRHNTVQVKYPMQIYKSNDVFINNFIIDSCRKEVNSMIFVQGDCSNIIFKNGKINNSLAATGNGFGLWCDDSDGVYPKNVFSENVIFSYLKTGFSFDASGCTNINFRDCIFSNNGTNGTIRSFMKFSNCEGYKTVESGTLTFTAAMVQKTGSATLSLYPDKTKFRFQFLDDGGNATKIWCDYTNGNPTNNFRVNIDTVPGKSIDIRWTYDHNY